MILTFFEESMPIVLQNVPKFEFAWLFPYDSVEGKCFQQEYCTGSAESFPVVLGRHIMSLSRIIGDGFES